MAHTRQEVLAQMQSAAVAAVATVSGDKMRTRMMHFAVTTISRLPG